MNPRVRVLVDSVPAKSRSWRIHLAPCGHDVTVPPQLPETGRQCWVPSTILALMRRVRADCGVIVAQNPASTPRADPLRRCVTRGRIMTTAAILMLAGRL